MDSHTIGYQGRGGFVVRLLGFHEYFATGLDDGPNRVCSFLVPLDPVEQSFFGPARREFLKSERTERQKISELVSRYAMAYLETRFHLEMDGKRRFHSPGRGDAREVLAEVFGTDTAKRFLALSTKSNEPMRIHGFISPPDINRGTRKELTFFANGRWVRDTSLSAAVLQAYHGLLMVGRFPLVVIFLDMPADGIDVNVHPGKAEVRFREPDAASRPGSTDRTSTSP